VEKVRPCSIVDSNHFVNIAKRRAKELNVLHPNTALFANQFENEANYESHFNGTGPEIYNQVESIDAFVMGAGTGGTLSGVSSFLKPLVPNINIVLADPQGSGLYTKVKHGVLYNSKEKEGSRTRHQVDTIVEGVGQNRWTRNIERLFEDGLVDDAVSVGDMEAVEMSRFVMREDGLFLGSSAAINLVASYRVAKALGPGHTIVTILCDSGSRHLAKFWSEEYCAKTGLTPKYGGVDDFIK
jgi:cysteine synthase A